MDKSYKETNYMADWKIVVKPEGKNPGGADDTNEGGMVLYLHDGSAHQRQEVSRVAFARRHSRNPDVPFKNQLDVEMEKARTAVGVLNEQLAGAGDLA